MAITKLSDSSITTGDKYISMLAGNSAYMPPSYESIATVSGSGVQILTFSSIPSTYKHLQIRGIGFSSTSDNWSLRFNNDSNTNYTVHGLRGTGASASALGYASPFDNKGSFIGLGAGGAGSNPTVSIIDIHDYTSTTAYKTVRSFWGTDSNGSGNVGLASNLWLSTSAITRIDIITTNYNMNAGTSYALYGIKG